MKNNNRFIAGGVILATLAILTYVGKDSLSRHFPAFGSLFQGGFSLTSKSQEVELAIKQKESLEDAEATIVEAEKLLAETIAADTPATGTAAMPAKAPQPWTLHAPDSGVTPALSLNPKIKVYSPVTLEPHPDRLPVTGDQIVLPMFDGKSVKANVESTESNANGDYIWSGHLVGHATDYPIVMTYGENTTFATITTPEGSYSLEAVKGVGWLYKNPAEAELTSQGKNDFLIPDIH